MSPWVSPHTFRLWIGIVGATIRCSLLLWTSSFSLPFSLNVVFLFLPRSLTAALPCFVVTNFVSLISVQSTKNSLTPLLLLSPKSLTTFRGPWLSSHSHIPSSRSFSCNRLSGNKKSRHTNAYRLPAKRIDLSPAVVASHSCNRLWNPKSKLSFTLFRLSTA